MLHRWLAPLIVLALGLLASPAAADIYQCTGPDGEMHFTNVRTPGRRCRVVVRGRGPAARASRTPQGRRSTQRTADRYYRYDPYIREAAALYQLPEPFIRAVMRVESDFTPDVVSHAGAMGLMQLMPRTALSMGVRNPFDPRENILGGARFLRLLANRFNGDLMLTIAAYNAGQGAVERHRGIPPYAETRRYVRNVLRYYYAFRAAPASRMN